MTNIIPPITDPMGRHWEQPDPSGFLIDDKHVIMSQKDCDKLATYSLSDPTGKYIGKCWKRERPFGSGTFWLVWLSECSDPSKRDKYLDVTTREILTV